MRHVVCATQRSVLAVCLNCAGTHTIHICAGAHAKACLRGVSYKLCGQAVLFFSVG
jgi:hypothetical protein